MTTILDEYAREIDRLQRQVDTLRDALERALAILDVVADAHEPSYYEEYEKDFDIITAALEATW